MRVYGLGSGCGRLGVEVWGWGFEGGGRGMKVKRVRDLGI